MPLIFLIDWLLFFHLNIAKKISPEENFRIKQICAWITLLPFTGHWIFGQPFWLPALFSVRGGISILLILWWLRLISAQSIECFFPNLSTHWNHLGSFRKYRGPCSTSPECSCLGISNRSPDDSKVQINLGTMTLNQSRKAKEKWTLTIYSTLMQLFSLFKAFQWFPSVYTIS